MRALFFLVGWPTRTSSATPHPRPQVKSMRIKLESLEAKLTQLTANMTPISDLSAIDPLSAADASSAAELSDGSWTVVASDSQGSDDGIKGKRGQRNRRNRRRKQQNQKQGAIAAQMSKQETLISLLMADPPLRKVSQIVRVVQTPVHLPIPCAATSAPLLPPRPSIVPRALPHLHRSFDATCGCPSSLLTFADLTPLTLS